MDTLLYNDDGDIVINQSLGALDLGTSLYNTAVGAYALRRLFGEYTGAQVRVRRSTDNAETDVYFSSDGSIQNLNLTTWLGGGTAYVKTWYDQSGNGNDITQTNTTLQPILTAPSGEAAYIRFEQSKIMTGPNVFGSSSVTDSHVIFASRENTRSGNFFINLNGTNTNGTSGRFSFHSPWVDGTWYYDPGSATTNRAQSGSNATAVGAKVVFSGYKSSADGKNGFRLNGGTRFLSSGTTSADVTGGIRIGEGVADHSIYDLIIFSSKLSAANESYIESVVSETNIDTLTTLLPNTGRYVRLQQTVNDRIINLREIEVYDENNVNVALNKPVTGNTPAHGSFPYSNLTDGITNTDTNIGHTTGYQITGDNYDYVQIDLGSITTVSRIFIYNRTDSTTVRNRAIGIKAILIAANGTTIVKETPTITTSSATYTLTF